MKVEVGGVFMALIDWKQKYSVKVKEMDTQHMKLIGMINNLYERMKKNPSIEIIAPLIQELLSYTKVHFATEEYYMKESDYPGYSEQREQHGEFLNKIMELQQKFEEGNIINSMEIIKFIKAWLVHHISNEDCKYSLFFNVNGID